MPPPKSDFSNRGRLPLIRSAIQVGAHGQGDEADWVTTGYRVGEAGGSRDVSVPGTLRWGRRAAELACVRTSQVWVHVQDVVGADQFQQPTHR
jgi:hypothetical protein